MEWPAGRVSASVLALGRELHRLSQIIFSGKRVPGGMACPTRYRRIQYVPMK